MSNIVTTNSQAAIAPATSLYGFQFSAEEVQLIKQTICKGANDAELGVFLWVCQQHGYHPLAKQIHAVKRYDSSVGKEVWSYQVGIDGFRLSAERTGKYRGQLGPFWCGTDGVWKEEWISDEAPVAAKVAVLKEGIELPFWGHARYKSYVQLTRDKVPNATWAKMPDGQLAKCAEALAFRKAFPQELGGLHTDDEMGQADNPSEPRSNPAKDLNASFASTPAPPAEKPKAQVRDAEHRDLTIEEKRELIVKNFLKNFEVAYPLLEKLLGRNVDEWTDEDCATVSSIYKQLVNKQAEPENFFGDDYKNS